MYPASALIQTGVLGGPRKCVCSREYGLKTIYFTQKFCINHQRLSRPDCNTGPTITCLAHAIGGQREVAESEEDESFSTLSPCFLGERLGSHGNSRSTQRHTQTQAHASSAVQGVPYWYSVVQGKVYGRGPMGAEKPSLFNRKS